MRDQLVLRQERPAQHTPEPTETVESIWHQGWASEDRPFRELSRLTNRLRDELDQNGTGVNPSSRFSELASVLSRVEALLRRLESAARIRIGDLELEANSGRAWRAGKTLCLSPREFQLLRHFIGQRNRILSRDYLMREVWGYEAKLSSRTVDVHVAWLRQKLGAHYIETVRGEGYRFSVPEPMMASAGSQ